MTQKSDTAFIAGSFNPFTLGHKSIVDRTLSIFSNVVIAIGYNSAKSNAEGIDKRLEAIREIYAGDSRVKVISYDGLTVDAARKCGATAMVRGVRSVADFEYERELAEANLAISGIETLLLPALPKYSFISSSMVRELQRYGKDVSEFLP